MIFLGSEADIGPQDVLAAPPGVGMKCKVIVMIVGLIEKGFSCVIHHPLHPLHQADDGLGFSCFI
jgi:hypothetical protein